GQYVLIFFAVLLVVLAAVFHKKLHDAWLSTRRFLREVNVEMKKVSWPSKNDTISFTYVVMVAIISLTVIITVWDQILSWVLNLVLQRGA
ncbi:MAG: preprotein translocase subunit SecE, partial [Candidatus Sumerlaeota bacterium]